MEFLIIAVVGFITLGFGFFLAKRQYETEKAEERKQIVDLSNHVKHLEEKLEETAIEKEKIAEKHLESYSDKERMSQELRDTIEKLNETEDKLGQEREYNKKLISQKKSSETRLGQISEHLVPFLKDCPYNPKDLHFCGNPIDYLVYDFDQGRIVFLEVKSGNSKASKRQKTIKNIINSGRVFYEEMRINTRGVKIRKDKNEQEES